MPRILTAGAGMQPARFTLLKRKAYMPDEFILAAVELFIVPIAYVVATPFVLISAPFRVSGVRGGYAAVRRFIKDWC
ncbi:hypothetical protein [Lacipirellula limnantheis]|nr:hypothetical protein [Lacipirellula limnantheis]